MNEIQPFLKRLITDNENWVTYNNDVLRSTCAQKCVANLKLTPSEVMVCLQWHRKQIMYQELLTPRKKRFIQVTVAKINEITKSYCKKKPIENIELKKTQSQYQITYVFSYLAKIERSCIRIFIALTMWPRSYSIKPSCVFDAKLFNGSHLDSVIFILKYKNICFKLCLKTVKIF